MRMVLHIAASLLIACALAACQLQDPASGTMPDDGETALASIAVAAARNGPDWEQAEDYSGKLFLLQ